VPQDNISTSVVSELGHSEEEEELLEHKHFCSTKDLPNKVPTGEMEELRPLILSRQIDSTPDGEEVLSHAHTL
jgi:hypothetical protein